MFVRRRWYVLESLQLPAMIALDVMRRRSTLQQLVLRDDGRIGRPLVRAVQLRLPSGEAIHHLL